MSEALYLRDPDQNGVELYWDKPQARWPRNTEGKLAMFSRRLDIDDLLSEPDLRSLPAPERRPGAPVSGDGNGLDDAARQEAPFLLAHISVPHFRRDDGPFALGWRLERLKRGPSVMMAPGHHPTP